MSSLTLSLAIACLLLTGGLLVTLLQLYQNRDRSRQRLKKNIKELSILYDVSEAFSRTLELSELIHTVDTVLRRKIKIPQFSLFFLDDKKEFLVPHLVDGFRDKDEIKKVKIPLGEGITGKTVASRRVRYVEDLSIRSRHLHYKAESEEEGSLLSFPLVAADVVVGVLNLAYPQASAFSSEQIKLYESMANQIAIAYDRSQLYRKTKELSVTDELTGISNRRHFQDVLKMELKRSDRFNKPLSLLMIDADYFKQYNDTYGHLKGDEALRQLANLFVRNIREIDTVARFGGEEFVMVLVDTDINEARSISQKLCQLVYNHANLFYGPQEKYLHLTVSIGVSSYPQFAKTEEELINTADIALYQAKEQGRNTAVTYDSIQTSSETVAGAVGL